MRKTATLRGPLGGDLELAGGVLGLVEDGPDLAAHLERGAYEAVLLGVPFEDLDAIRATHGHEQAKPFERDETDEVYLAQLGRFGTVRVPPGDLYAAYGHAASRGLPVEAIDLGDEGHSETWTQHVGMFELLRNNRRLKRLPAETFAASTAEEFAYEWDRKLFPTKGLRRVQDDREVWMARRTAELVRDRRRVFALVPLARWAGVRDRLVRDQRFQLLG